MTETFEPFQCDTALLRPNAVEDLDAFWGAVWGIPGMFLSVPIMVMMLVICSHVPGLRKVAVLLSREGLPEDERELDRLSEEIESRKGT